jgi:hypothetical protein
LKDLYGGIFVTIGTMKKTTKKISPLKVKIALVTGTALIVSSPVLAYLLAPIGCVLFPQVEHPGLLYVFPVCSGVNFVAFWIILVIILTLGTFTTIRGIRGFKLNKSS